MKTEIRNYSVSLRAVRDEQEDDLFALEGTACSYDSLSGDLGGFRERLQRGCFTRSLSEHGVKCLHNHNGDHVLGSTQSGTLKIIDGPKGLQFRAQLDPNNSHHKNVYQMVKRGDVNQCSFAFSLPYEDGDVWDEATDERGNKFIRRTIKQAKISEVSVVAFPAYNAPGATSVDARTESDSAVDAFNRQRCEEIRQEIEKDFERRIAAAHEAVRDSALNDLGIKIKGDK